jgi:Family of unknown function (DUF6519)
MSSDLARVTYDPSRRYHGVVAQQGRVSLEADWNEAQAITREQIETRTLDLIGPAASPDRGYRVEPVVTGEGAATGDLRISRGAAYVGGQRVSLGGDICYSNQPDWRDHAKDPLWREATVPEEQPRELVYLMLREQEVSAVEDPALRDVALGGPDTTQRLRILQRVIRYPTAAPTWEDAWAQLIGQGWDANGLRLERRGSRLQASARLQVTGNPAEGHERPVDDATYLGPNNQLIRVQIAGLGDDGGPRLVWGYDNASFMYRLSDVRPGTAPDTTAFSLVTAPVDAYHQPAENQAVEVLRGAASLTPHDVIAAATGQIATVTHAYDPDTRAVVIRPQLPQEYDPASGPLFLRVWQGEFECKPGEEYELRGTGLRVRLTVAEDAPGRFTPGAYWMIAIRPAVDPGSASVVYPHPILDAPQPPDGPRLWLAPLAFIRWHPRAPIAEDCLPRFQSLAAQEHSGGSCTVSIGPQDAGAGWALQDAIDAHASGDRATTICLEPGTYALRQPLRIGPRHGRLTLRAERHGVVLCAEQDTDPRFALGLIAAEDADGLSLHGLEFRPAQVPFALGQDVYFHLPERARDLLAAHRRRRIAIGVHASRCASLSIEDCRFAVSPPGSPAADGEAPADAPAGSPAAHASEDLFAVAIFGSQEISGLRIVRCTFTVTEPLEHARRDAGPGPGPDRRDDVALAFAQVPSAMAAPHGELEPAAHGSASLPLLDDAVFEENVFERLTAPAVVIGQLGTLRIERNTVRDCHAGFWLITQQASHVLTFLDRLVNQSDDAYRELVDAHLTSLAEPLLFHTTVMARTLPDEIADDPGASLEPRRLELPGEADERQASELHHQLSTPDTEPEPAPGPAQAESWRRRFVDTFGRVRGTRRQPEVITVPPEAALRCLLNMSGNTVQTGTAPALVVLDTAPNSAASLILTGNHLRDHVRPGASACLYLLRTCTAAANVIINGESEHRSAASLLLRPRRHQGRAETAITGNVLTGRAHLPERRGELPGWRALNSVTPS